MISGDGYGKNYKSMVPDLSTLSEPTEYAQNPRAAAKWQLRGISSTEAFKQEVSKTWIQDNASSQIWASSSWKSAATVPIIFLEWMQMTPTITMMFKTFFKIMIWLMPFLIFMEEHPAMHFWGSKQINLISISRRLSPYVQKAYILDPNDSEGDHSTIGIDFDFGLLISNHDLSDIEPGHIQNCTLVSTLSRTYQEKESCA